MNKKKQGFVLDCCNTQNSKLRPYESKKDLYLAGFFAMKDHNLLKNAKTKSEKLSKKKKQMLPQPYITKFPAIKHSHTTKSLPPIDTRRSKLSPLTKDEFQALISKYRQDL